MSAVLNKLKPRTGITAIGLDLGQSALRAAQIQREGDNWRIVNLASCRRRSPDRGGDEAQYLRRAATWVRDLNLKQRKVVMGLTPPDVELHRIDLTTGDRHDAALSESELIHEELSRISSFEPAVAEACAWPLPEGTGLQSASIGVAARGEQIDDCLSLCAMARLECGCIDATPCALSRFGAVYLGLGASRSEVWSILDWGARSSRLVVCVGATPVLVRTFSSGGRDWTEKLAQSLGVSTDSAERHKCDHGIALNVPSENVGESVQRATRTLQEMAFNVLRTDLDEMSAELERSYRYVLQCYRGTRPGPLVMVGGGAGMRGLDRLLSERLGIPVIVAGAELPAESRLILDGFDEWARRDIALYACAIGLALPEEATHGAR